MSRLPSFYSFKETITIVGRSVTQVDYVLCSADHIQNTIISRIHARIIRDNVGQHRLHDDSLNGVFINGYKIDGRYFWLCMYCANKCKATL